MKFKKKGFPQKKAKKTSTLIEYAAIIAHFN